MVLKEAGRENLEILKQKILRRDMHGVFISPILSEKEKEDLALSLDRPLIFAQIPICHPGKKRVVEFEARGWIGGMWIPALEKKSDFREFKGIATISYEHFVKYIIGTFGSYGAIVIMRNFPMGFNGVGRRETIDELEYNSVKLTKDVKTEFEALAILQGMGGNSNEVSNKELLQKTIVVGTDWSYDDEAIYLEEKVMFKTGTAKYIVLTELFRRYNNGSTPCSRENLVSLLQRHDHAYTKDTIRTLISKIRDNIRGYGNIKCKKANGRNDEPGYYFVQQSTNCT